MMNIIITMAGLGSRFRKVGYDIPKYQISAHDKTLFEWSLLSLDSFDKTKSRYHFIVRKEDNTVDFIEKTLKKLGINNYNIIEIDYLTSGQAETAFLAIPYCNKDEEILIYNIDTYINPKFLLPSDIKGDGFIPCFNAPGDHWSFAKTDETGKVVEVREKVKISDHASLGVYYFKSAELYQKIYNEFYSNDANTEKNEKYIAPMYNYMIEKNMEVNICDIPFEKVHVLGTPEELEYFKKLDIYE